MILYLTYESCDTLKSFSSFVPINTISKLNMDHCVKFGIYKFKKKADVVPSFRERRIWSVHVVSQFAEDGNEIYGELKRTCIVFVLLIKTVSFSDVPVAVAVVVFLNSLKTEENLPCNPHSVISSCPLSCMLNCMN